MNSHNKIVPVPLKSLDIKIPSNYVLIEYDTKLYSKTTGGIFIPENFLDEANYINRIGTVIKVPKTLYFYRGADKSNETRSMRWKTDIEIKEGDTVWINHMGSQNAYIFTFEDRFFKIIHYEDIATAKRKDEVIMCNGYILLEELYETLAFGAYEKDVKIQGKGKIAYIGNRNQKYNIPESSRGSTIIYREDPFCEFNIGEIAYINTKYYNKVRYLEDSTQKRFDNKMLLIVQGYMIVATE